MEGGCTFKLSDTGSFYVTSQVLDQFNKHGYIIVRDLFDFEEISKLKDHFETHQDIQKHAYGRSDGNNRMSKLCIWNKAGDDLSGIVARYFHGKNRFFFQYFKKIFSIDQPKLLEQCRLYLVETKYIITIQN